MYSKDRVSLTGHGSAEPKENYELCKRKEMKENGEKNVYERAFKTPRLAFMRRSQNSHQAILEGGSVIWRRKP